jgi:hypothetical protein
MRYFLVTYMKKPDGRMDELVSVSQRCRPRDLTEASVILDFRDKAVLKSSLRGTTIPRDWQRIRDYYHLHYAKVIDQLESSWPNQAT